MTQAPLPTGVPTGGKPVNLEQLQSELATAGTTVNGLGMADEAGIVFTYAGVDPADFPTDQVAAVQTAIANHVAMRDKTDEEYAVEFQTANSTRKNTINGIVTGLIPREKVPM